MKSVGPEHLLEVGIWVGAPMKAAKLSCLCAAEGSGTHTLGDAFQHIKKII